jgi:xylose isomerase
MALFADVAPIRFEGAEATSDLAFRVYDKDRMVLNKRMGDWLRVAVCYWHSFTSTGVDMFGSGTIARPWQNPVVTQAMAETRADAAFEFISRLGASFFAFHDLDVMATAQNVRGHEMNLRKIEEYLHGKMLATGVKLLWGTANLFSDPRFAAGGTTNPDPAVFAYAAAQVRFCMETTQRLGGENYVLWGGREGYDTLLNTDFPREVDHYGRFLSMVVDHKHRIGYKGTILIEPKPFEPTKHQYDRDTAAVYAFLERFGLANEVKVNIEVNHATLAGLDFEHEIAAARTYGILGSIDINRGDPRCGWDTDQFPNNAQDLVPAMLQIIANGGLGGGGFNFDAKLRRNSVDVTDLYVAHIGGMDTLARALLAAESLIREGTLERLRQDRYKGWKSELGRRIEAGEFNLGSLCDYVIEKELDPHPQSGRQELAENIIAAHCKF